MGSEAFSANVRISEAFLALRPAGSRIVAKTVCPLRARVSANSLPNPVLEPVMRTTCLEFMIILPWWRYREFDAGSKAVGYKNEFNRLPTGEMKLHCSHRSELDAPFRNASVRKFGFPKHCRLN